MDAPLPAPATIAWYGLVIGLLFGAVGQRTRFCTLGAISDGVLMGDWTRMRMWGLAMAVALAGTTGLQLAGLVDTSASIYTAGRLPWLSHLVGGLLFGAGMTLASGCGAKTLIRLGGGNLKSLVVFIVLGLSASMTLRGLFGVWRVGTLDRIAVELGPSQSLAALSGFPALGLIVAALLGIACLTHPAARSPRVIVGGTTVGALVVAGWFVTGHLGFIPEHPETLAPAFIGTNSGRPESLTFVAPYAYSLELLTLWSDTSKTVTFGVASVLGVILGAGAGAVAARELRLEGFRDPADLARHLIGAVLMGFGGVTALGCTIGQGLTGFSTLAPGALLTTAAIIAGAILTMKLEYRLMAQGN
ncbi:MAG: YeeE/YedE family protein [Rhodocyclaceae bacterium]|jgi:uncharacterized membrane protein YedE/YeeE|nr:YeeE/YedE family protein [Rhodocyclaceae bacterium]